mmetsp:Transcript_3416/g.2394  ORF Transcript_3416/g.2394 Transcript_3416/m.2394 type:complete len:135 (-) Transcript_3416:396-800(-)
MENDNCMFQRNSLEMLPGIQNRRDDVDEEEGSYSESNPLKQLRLQRGSSRGYSNSGYLFLAVVFCMMCCSSLFYQAGSVKSTIEEVLSSTPIKAPVMPQFVNAGSRRLWNSPDKQAQNVNLADPLDEDVEMKEE